MIVDESDITGAHLRNLPTGPVLTRQTQLSLGFASTYRISGFGWSLRIVEEDYFSRFPSHFGNLF
jgi:hypothetical protein